MFGCSSSILPSEAKEWWDFWTANYLAYEAFTKEVQFFRIFNIAWIFCWEYRYQNYLLNSFPLSVVRIYKVRWWNEYKTKLCGKENVEYFCWTKPKKYTLQNIHTFDKNKEVARGPSTPTKMEVSSTSTKSKSKGLTQKQWDILKVLKDDPAMRQIFLQKLIDNGNLDDNSTSAESATKPRIADLLDSRNPYDLWQKTKEKSPQRSWPLAKVRAITN